MKKEDDMKHKKILSLLLLPLSVRLSFLPPVHREKKEEMTVPMREVTRTAAEP